MSLNAGDLTREFRLERPQGLDAAVYEDMGIEWGSLRFANGREVLRHGTPQATGAWTITIRYRDDLEASWRLVDLETETAYQVSDFGDPDGSNEQLQLYCVEAQ